VNLADYLEARRADVEAALVEALPAPPRCPPVLSGAMRYSLLGGGKRLRPILVLAACESVRPGQAGTVDALAMPAACAVEMIHTYSLIHDDLPAMDDDSLRRGRQTSHVVYGEGMAILAGDGLQAEAFALLARRPETTDPDLASRKLRALEVIAEAAGAVGMVGGQALDLDADPSRHHPGPTHKGEALPVMDAATLMDMHARKTGALIRASVMAGGIMGGADAGVIEALDRTRGKSALRSRSWTTCSTSRARRPTWARRPERMRRRVSPPTCRCTGWTSRRPWRLSASRGPRPRWRRSGWATHTSPESRVGSSSGAYDHAHALEPRTEGWSTARRRALIPADSERTTTVHKAVPWWTSRPTCVIGPDILPAVAASSSPTRSTPSASMSPARSPDIGASTGGFTDVLLQRGARRVIALDVGHGQLHWKLRTDPRVTVIEGANARHLTPADLPGIGEGVDFVSIDVSFISLALIFPVLPALLAPGARIVALVKPQFEAGRRDVGKKGVVSDPAVHDRVVAEVTAAAAEVGLERLALVDSPITGAQGNKEFLMLLEARP
jgi:geranylgeranyl pyrophosphate synthase